MKNNQDSCIGKIIVDKDNIRIDIFLQNQFSNFSRTKIKNFILSKKIKVNEKPTRPSYILKMYDSITYDFTVIKKEIIVPKKMNLDIIYEDDQLIVINKPSGLVVHPGNGTVNDTLVNGLVFHFSKLSSVYDSRPGIVHRLDKETSGVILIAKDDQSHIHLSKQFEDRTVKKKYRAITWGDIGESGQINGYINRDRKDRTIFTLNDNINGKFSESNYKRIDYLNPMSHVEIQPKTGRTHQIRVHLKSISHPILCDFSYGGGSDRIKSYHMKHNKILKKIINTINRVALHAFSIEIEHPLKKERMTFNAPIPKDFNDCLKLLKEYQNVS